MSAQTMCSNHICWIMTTHVCSNQKNKTKMQKPKNQKRIDQYQTPKPKKHKTKKTYSSAKTPKPKNQKKHILICQVVLDLGCFFFLVLGFGMSLFYFFLCFALHGSFLQNTILRSCFESYTPYTHPSNLWLAMPLLPRACAAAKPKPYPTSWPQFPENHICLYWGLLPHVWLTSALSSFRPTDDDEPLDTESDGQEHLGLNHFISSYTLYAFMLCAGLQVWSVLIVLVFRQWGGEYGASWLHHVCLLNCLASAASASSTPPQDRWRQHAWDTA